MVVYHYIISMTITCFHDDHILAIIFKTTSSRLKLANCSTHGGETLCTYVLHHFHDDHNNKKPQELFLITTSSLFKLTNSTTYGDETWYACVTTTLFEQQQVAIRQFSYKYLLHFSNSAACMEMKLGTRAYYFISMRTICFYDDYI